jgi:hypothetical protein
MENTLKKENSIGDLAKIPSTHIDMEFVLMRVE